MGGAPPTSSSSQQLPLGTLRVWKVLEPFLTTPEPKVAPPLLVRTMDAQPQLPHSLDFELSVTTPSGKHSVLSRMTINDSPVKNMHRSSPGTAAPLLTTTPGSEEDLQVAALASSLNILGTTPLNPEQRLAVAGLMAQCQRPLQQQPLHQMHPRQRHVPGGQMGTAAPAGPPPLSAVYHDNWPCVLFGPPGTGKTVTLVEAALQLLGWDPVTKTCKEGAPRLLLVAPQNFSADNMCERLSRAGLPVSLMSRLNDPRRRMIEAVAATLDYSHMDEELRSFALPDPHELSTRKVVVCSCAGSGLLREGLFAGEAHTFDVVLMDEAGQAMMPEALIPLTLLKPGGRAMLCGDPQQLGPSVRSMKAASSGLATSLLELLVRCAHYCASHALHSPVKVVWLVRNYRSEARLLDLPSRLFYQGRLQPWADPASVQPPNWAALQALEGPLQPEVPPATATTHATTGQRGVDEEGDHELPPLACNTLFFGVRGEQRQEADAPSYFNAIEATVVVDLVSSLLEATSQAPGGQKVQSVVPQDVGIICTYRRQVKKLRELLRERHLGAINVGTVDDFQGQEVRVVFISTVLSDPDSLPTALPVARGAAWGGGPLEQLNAQVYKQPESALWSNPARFNVAITRCKALLVVVGHPLVLSRDPCWRELLRHCAARGAFQGAGAALLRRLLRDPGAGRHDGNGEGEGQEEEEEEEDSVELQVAMEYITSHAVLGIGGAAQLYPDSMDEFNADSMMDDMPFRVAL